MVVVRDPAALPVFRVAGGNHEDLVAERRELLAKCFDGNCQSIDPWPECIGHHRNFHSSPLWQGNPGPKVFCVGLPCYRIFLDSLRESHRRGKDFMPEKNALKSLYQLMLHWLHFSRMSCPFSIVRIFPRTVGRYMQGLT
jgi:hypothetical protein